MIKKQYRTPALLTLTMLALAFSSPAQAQRETFIPGQGQTEEEGELSTGVINQYDPKYKPSRIPIEQAGGVIPLGQYAMYFVRKPQKPNHVATLRFSTTIAVEGCLDVNFPPIESFTQGPNMWVKIKDPKLTAQRRQDCNDPSATPSVEFDFNRNALRSKGIKQIIFQSETNTDYYTLEIDQHHMKIKPKTTPTAFKKFRLSTRKEALTHWFYPKNLILLSVPRANATADISEQIETVAKKHKLQEAQKAIRGFTPPGRDPGTYYFVDRQKKIAKLLTHGSQLQVDTIQVPDHFIGTNGPYTLMQDYDVYARLPGEYD